LSTSQATSQARPRQRHLSDRAIINLFIWPTLILLILMNVLPLAYSLFLSFTEYSAIRSAAPVWIGLENFIDLLNDEDMWRFFATTGRYALITVAASRPSSVLAWPCWCGRSSTAAGW
jgi:multiple sugar transport system permease protein